VDNPSSPFAESRSRTSGLLIHALGGLQAGIAGVIRMFACFVVAALWNGRGLWSVPNLFSTVLYGEDAYQGQFRRSTWAGLALIVVLYGVAGVVWGCVWKRRKPLLPLYGALTGLATYYLFFSYVWIHVDAMIPLYAPITQLQVAHILWGMALAASPDYAARIKMAITPTVVAPPNAEASQEAAESISGELIR
jgi:hypothetical protein